MILSLLQQLRAWISQDADMPAQHAQKQVNAIWTL